MLIRFFLRYPVLALIFHIGLGFLTQDQPLATAIYYVVITVVAMLEIVSIRDQSNLAAYYALYLAGLEILSRMSKAAIFWEFGKYSLIAVLGLGIVVGDAKPPRPYLLLAYFALLLPGIVVAAAYGGVGEARLLDLVSQYLSGPAALMVAAWYFNRRVFQKSQLVHLLQVGILPAIAVITLLFLGKSLSEIDFVGGSNFEASGGFGPNQVSSALGWSIVLMLIGLLFNASLTGYRVLDISLLVLLVLRGLLTFSRGGMMGAFGSVSLSMIVLYGASADYRMQMKRLLSKVLTAALLLFAVAFIANALTDNFLLYRYQGKSTSEVILGKTLGEKAYFSGREEIIEGELLAFMDNPLLGIGVGRGTVYREREFGSGSVASHTEFSRMLSEHGILGLIAIICAFVVFPFRHFKRLANDDTRQWMLTFFILSMFTLFHSGMRLSLPSLAYGLSLICIIPPKPAN